MDLSNPDSIRQVVREIQPDLILNAAAYVRVDQAESDLELAMAVNGVALGVIAGEAKRIGAMLIHYPADYVFDETKTIPLQKTMSPVRSTSMGAPNLKVNVRSRLSRCRI